MSVAPAASAWRIASDIELAVNTRVTLATGTAEREAALAMAEEIPGVHRVTLGADKNYDTRDFVREVRWRRVTPQVARNNTHRASAIDQRTTRYPGYAISQQKRKRVEEIFGWMLAAVVSPWNGCSPGRPRFTIC